MNQFISLLQNINIELFSVINFAFYLLSLLIFLTIGGLNGLQGFVYLSLIVANIQILKGSNFFFTPEPVALGTIMYGMISIALSIITEFYGQKAAKKTINLGLIFMISFSIFMILTIGHKPIDHFDNELKFLHDNHFAMKQLFLPMPIILISSLIAYFISERGLVFIQIALRKIFHNRFDNLRIYLANAISAFLDLFIMNYLCWIAFSSNPITMKQMFISYIFSSYPFRFFTSTLAIPSIYLARMIFKKMKNNEN
jgi:uncharacterized integral membrane protein (TIGR00697 family)